MKKYLTGTNIALFVCSIAILIMAIAIGSNQGQPKQNKSGYEILQQHNQSLMRDLEQSRRNYQQLMIEVQATKSRDSALKAQYQQRILKDYYTIQALNKRKDEKIRLIDGASDSLLRAILANY